MPFLFKFLLMLSLVVASSRFGRADLLLVDNFDSGSLNAGWDKSTRDNPTIGTATGISGSNFASLRSSAAGSSVLAYNFTNSVVGVSNFKVDFFVKTNASAGNNRQFSFQVAFGIAGNEAIGLSSPTNDIVNAAGINLRYQTGQAGLNNWSAFLKPTAAGGAFANVGGGLPNLVAGQWQRVAIEGAGFGTGAGNASYKVSVWNTTNATEIPDATTGNIRVWNASDFNQGSPDLLTAKSFNFNTAFGSNPGFHIDNVTISTTAVPEPGTLAMLGVCGLATCCYSRRKRS